MMDIEKTEFIREKIYHLNDILTKTVVAKIKN